MRPTCRSGVSRCRTHKGLVPPIILTWESAELVLVLELKVVLMWDLVPGPRLYMNLHRDEIRNV